MNSELTNLRNAVRQMKAVEEIAAKEQYLYYHFNHERSNRYIPEDKKPTQLQIAKQFDRFQAAKSQLQDAENAVLNAATRWYEDNETSDG